MIYYGNDLKYLNDEIFNVKSFIFQLQRKFVLNIDDSNISSNNNMKIFKATSIKSNKMEIINLDDDTPKMEIETNETIQNNENEMKTMNFKKNDERTEKLFSFNEIKARISKKDLMDLKMNMLKDDLNLNHYVDTNNNIPIKRTKTKIIKKEAKPNQNQKKQTKKMKKKKK